MITLMVPFRTFSFLDFLAGLLQKTFSVATNLLVLCVFSVLVSAPYSKILRFVKDIFDPQVKVKQSRYTPWRRLGGEEV
jgi:hypothetical protein